MTYYGETCDEKCGWIAALVSAIAFGSFAVPIKGEAANSVDIDPLVMQSYKTTMCFITSWSILLLGQEFNYTPWGIVSGMFWIPGGTMAIFSVRNAGLAVSQGVWSSMIVAVSFIWGIFVFQEDVKSVLWACIAVLLMTTGLFGMSYYSVGSSSSSSDLHGKGAYEALTTADAGSSTTDDINVILSSDDKLDDDDLDFVAKPTRNGDLSSTGSQEMSDSTDTLTEDLESIDVSRKSSNDDNYIDNKKWVICCGKRINRRVAGLISAFLCGTWGGSVMVPMHYAPPNTGGLAYTISFAIGAAIVNISFWIIRFLYNVKYHGGISKGWRALPSFHFEVMWLPGILAGTVWSIGNIASIVSVEYLGEGVGYSVTQSSMLISGIWGIVWFREIRGIGLITKWLLAAILTVFSILLLSYEHTSSIAP